MYMLLISIKVYSFIVKDKNKSKYRVYILYFNLFYILALDFKASLFKSFLWWA